MTFNLSELTSTSFNSIEFNLTKFTAENNLVAMATIDINNPNPLQNKAHLTNFNLSNFKIIKVMRLRITATRFP
jgi:hypothetical protein